MLNLAVPSLAPLEPASTHRASMPVSLPTTLTAPPGGPAAGDRRRDGTGLGAGRGIRTPDLLITNQMLCQLSYSGNVTMGF